MTSAEPRCVHYQFAHVALRQLIFSEPRFVRALWELEDPRALLDDIAVQVTRECRRQGEGGALHVDELGLHRLTIGSYPCVIIELPEPGATTEAFMVALVDLDGEGSEDPAEDAAPRRRYFTLEYSAHREAPHTVLAEWTSQGSHMNMGGGPEPSVEAFVTAIARLILD
ncbi:hypothetical protein G6O69_13340 [Pseudenhygromyxa sp. WMMC2535]|uniref:hypothetical protein n=1 Tax=Pseudenhygromyxa sp. WMMC2535 TaxID=2712867 RepID=UPI00155285A8|nr:hypothetical protein [Pseudenhygromyxa sp. WMMC2535]NVB38819.1 hypothetical protein [Pseudenhygromyxa sp. WMMC2535]